MLSRLFKYLSNTTEMGFIWAFPPDWYFCLNILQNTVYIYITAGYHLQNKYVKHKLSPLSILLENLQSNKQTNQKNPINKNTL